MKRAKVEPKVGPSDFQAEIARLIATEKLPTLSQLVQAIHETREIYRPKILAARKKAK